MAAFNAQSGARFVRQRSRTDVRTPARCFQAVEAACPRAATIWIALDNWPVHFPEHVETALAQPMAIPLTRPAQPRRPNAELICQSSSAPGETPAPLPGLKRHRSPRARTSYLAAHGLEATALLTFPPLPPFLLVPRSTIERRIGRGG